MKKRIAAIVAVVALVGAADAGAHAKSYPSTISFDLFECLDCAGKGPVPLKSIITGGQVSSDLDKCVRKRRVQMYGFGALDAIDVDTTSYTGAWSGRGLVPQDTDHLVANLLRKKLKHGRCEGDTADYFLDT